MAGLNPFGEPSQAGRVGGSLISKATWSCNRCKQDREWAVMGDYQSDTDSTEGSAQP